MKRKALYAIMIITVIIGAVIIVLKDFNYSTLYSKHKRLEIVIERQYDINEVSKIVKETIKTKPVVRASTIFETSLSIDAKEFKEEEIANLFNKLNEKYSQNYQTKDLKKFEILEELEIENPSDYSDEELDEFINQIKEKHNIEYTRDELKDGSSLVRLSDVEQTSIIDMFKGYLIPVLLSLVIVVLYSLIRFMKMYKHAWILVPLKLIFELVLNQAFLLSVIAIARIPISEYLPTILILVWLLQLISETIKNEKELQKEDEE